MNFLAHIYLSKSIDHLMLGNFMADSIKGKKYLDYPTLISKGILLHQFIDDFTDKHPLVYENKTLLRKTAGKYSPVVSDIVYDHFLACNFTEFTGLKLNDFVTEVYDYLLLHIRDMTPFAQQVVPYMIEHNWLENYHHKNGLQLIFNRFGERIGVDDLFNTITDVVWENYSLFENNFRAFFPILEYHVDKKRIELIATNS